MNKHQLISMGVPEDCVSAAIDAIQRAAKNKEHKNAKSIIPQIVAQPNQYFDSIYWGDFAKKINESKNFQRPEPIPYKSWGEIEPAVHAQMQQACSLPNAVYATVMSDSHVGFGVPIGGVLALNNAVCPFAVGSDIACRMRLTILDMPVESITKQFNLFKEAIEQGTNFGVGGEFKPRKNHPILDEDWNITKVTKYNKDKAWAQLGTSGSSNHFLDVGIVNFENDAVMPAGQYVAIMTHSGSRGLGRSVCDCYHGIAQATIPKKYSYLNYLAWLEMDSEAGQEYWAAMNLAAEYAKANHDVIHKSVVKLLGAKILEVIQNHHNMAWREEHFGESLIVHRKGATPTQKGVLGIIPGSMGTPAYVVRGLGNPDSLMSASHGAGRKMSRKQANSTYSWQAVRGDLEKKGIVVLSAGADESPGAYKDIDEVMAQQTDLVEPIAKFFPRIVKMDGSGSKAED